MKPYPQSLRHGNCGWLNSVQRVEFSGSGAFLAGDKLYYLKHVAYLKARLTNIITHGGNIYREHQNLYNRA